MTCNPSLASTTVMAEVRFMRWAKALLNTGGMCWVIMIAGESAGICSMTSLMASVPPVDAPMAMILSVVFMILMLAGRCRITVAEYFESTSSAPAAERDSGFISPLAAGRPALAVTLTAAAFLIFLMISSA